MEVEPQFVALQRIAKTFLEGPSALGLGVEGGFVPRETFSPAAFGDIESRVRVAQQGFDFEPVLGKDGYESASTMRGEAPKAFAAYKALLMQYHEVTRFAQKNGRLPAGVLNKVVPAFVESILRNPDAMA